MPWSMYYEIIFCVYVFQLCLQSREENCSGFLLMILLYSLYVFCILYHLQNWFVICHLKISVFLKIREEDEKRFGNVFRACLTLFQLLTLDDWGDILEENGNCFWFFHYSLCFLVSSCSTVIIHSYSPNKLHIFFNDWLHFMFIFDGFVICPRNSTHCLCLPFFVHHCGIFRLLKVKIIVIVLHWIGLHESSPTYKIKNVYFPNFSFSLFVAVLVDNFQLSIEAANVAGDKTTDNEKWKRRLEQLGQESSSTCKMHTSCTLKNTKYVVNLWKSVFISILYTFTWIWKVLRVFGFYLKLEIEWW